LQGGGLIDIMVDIMTDPLQPKRAKLFWTGRSQAVRLPKDLRLSGTEVLARRVGNTVVLEPFDQWPEGYLESFAGIEGLRRHRQGRQRQREPLE
jgi:virulence-associated protein VagC